MISSVLKDVLKPNLYWGARQLISPSGPPISMVMSSVKSSAQHLHVVPSRRVVRKLTFDGVASGNVTTDLVQESQKCLFQPKTPKKRGRKPRPPTPVVYSGLRRSPRSNIYKGFKIDQPSDSKKHESKVKDKMIINMYVASSTIPALISVEDLQKIGKEYCAIPDDDITTDKLVAENSEE